MENLLVSFSGGETSAFMAQWLNRNYERLGYKNIVFVFANTGEENEHTLEFVEKCDKYFNLNVKWVQARTRIGRKSTSYWHIDYKTAARNGEPFEEVIQKYGIPNQAAPHCTRELKQNPIKSFARDYFGGAKYHTAIGIRIDEFDRVSPNAKKFGFVYPLVDSAMIPATKKHINFYWSQMPFRLELKGYQGNCKTCWKKSDKKLYQIANEAPSQFDFMATMEEKYGFVGAEFSKDYEGKRERTFFRNNRSAIQILEEAKNWTGIVKDDSKDYYIQLNLDLDGESCEVFSECKS
jgi:hypothetical protein